MQENDQDIDGARGDHPMSSDFDDMSSYGRRRDDNALVVDLDGFEGPLDLLLNLARVQKVDFPRYPF